MKLSNNMYEVLKWFAMIGLPALGTFYFTVANLLGLPYAGEVSGIIVALVTCLSTMLRIGTSSAVTTGTITVGTDDNGAQTITGLSLNDPLPLLSNKNAAVLTIKSTAVKLTDKDDLPRRLADGT